MERVEQDRLRWIVHSSSSGSGDDMSDSRDPSSSVYSQMPNHVLPEIGSVGAVHNNCS